MRRDRRRSGGGSGFSSFVLRVFFFTLVVLGGIFYYHLHMALTENDVILSGVMAAILAFIPPGLTSFVFPSTPAGMMFQKVQSKTAGYGAILLAYLVFLVYTSKIFLSWWASYPIVAESDFVILNTIVCVIAFVIMPGLFWVPITDEEMIAAVQMQRAIDRYKMMADSEIQIIRARTVRMRALGIKAFADLTEDERYELKESLVSLTRGIERSLLAIKQGIATTTDGLAEFDDVNGNDELLEYLDNIDQALLLDSPNEDEYIEQQPEPQRIRETVTIPRRTLRSRR